MSFFNKSRVGHGPEMPPQRNPAPSIARSAAAIAVANMSTPSPVAGVSPRPGRLSNGLKEFLWQLDGIGRGHLLDLGPARQTTITFFIERGFKVYTDDLLMTWKNFLDAEVLRKKGPLSEADRLDTSPATRAERFLDGIHPDLPYRLRRSDLGTWCH